MNRVKPPTVYHIPLEPNYSFSFYRPTNSEYIICVNDITCPLVATDMVWDKEREEVKRSEDDYFSVIQVPAVRVRQDDLSSFICFRIDNNFVDTAIQYAAYDLTPMNIFIATKECGSPGYGNVLIGVFSYRGIGKYLYQNEKIQGRVNRIVRTRAFR